MGHFICKGRCAQRYRHRWEVPGNFGAPLPNLTRIGNGQDTHPSLDMSRDDGLILNSDQLFTQLQMLLLESAVSQVIFKTIAGCPITSTPVLHEASSTSTALLGGLQRNIRVFQRWGRRAATLNRRSGTTCYEYEVLSPCDCNATSSRAPSTNPVSHKAGER